MVYDVTSAESFVNVKRWLHEINQNCDDVCRILGEWKIFLRLHANYLQYCNFFLHSVDFNNLQSEIIILICRLEKWFTASFKELWKLTFVTQSLNFFFFTDCYIFYMNVHVFLVQCHPLWQRHWHWRDSMHSKWHLFLSTVHTVSYYGDVLNFV